MAGRGADDPTIRKAWHEGMQQRMQDLKKKAFRSEETKKQRTLDAAELAATRLAKPNGLVSQIDADYLNIVQDERGWCYCNFKVGLHQKTAFCEGQPHHLDGPTPDGPRAVMMAAGKMFDGDNKPVRLRAVDIGHHDYLATTYDVSDDEQDAAAGDDALQRENEWKLTREVALDVMVKNLMIKGKLSKADARQIASASSFPTSSAFYIDGADDGAEVMTESVMPLKKIMHTLERERARWCVRSDGSLTDKTAVYKTEWENRGLENWRGHQRDLQRAADEARERDLVLKWQADEARRKYLKQLEEQLLGEDMELRENIERMLRDKELEEARRVLDLAVLEFEARLEFERLERQRMVSERIQMEIEDDLCMEEELRYRETLFELEIDAQVEMHEVVYEWYMAWSKTQLRWTDEEADFILNFKEPVRPQKPILDLVLEDGFGEDQVVQKVMDYQKWGDLASVLEVMKRWPSNIHIQHLSCVAIGAIAVQFPADADPHELLKITERYLRNGGSAGHHDWIWACQGIWDAACLAILQAIRPHSQEHPDCTVLLARRVARLQTAGCTALYWVILHYHACVSELVSKARVRPIVMAINENPQVKLVLQHGGAVLAQLINWSVLSCSNALALGGAEAFRLAHEALPSVFAIEKMENADYLFATAFSRVEYTAVAMAELPWGARHRMRLLEQAGDSDDEDGGRIVERQLGGFLPRCRPPEPEPSLSRQRARARIEDAEDSSSGDEWPASPVPRLAVTSAPAGTQELTYGGEPASKTTWTRKELGFGSEDDGSATESGSGDEDGG
jgi:hypothetical protein